MTMTKNIESPVINQNKNLHWDFASVDQITTHLGEPNELKQRRFEAVYRLSNTPFPNITNEAWRRTNPDVIGQRKFRLWDPENTVGKYSNKPFEICSDEYNLKNGRLSNSGLQSNNGNPGYEFNDLSGAYNLGKAVRLRKLLLDDPEDKDSPALSLMNMAYHQGGFFLDISENSVNDFPIRINEVVNTPDSAFFSLNLINVRENSQSIVVINQDLSNSHNSWFGGQTRIHVDENAQLDLIIINRSHQSNRFYDHLWVKPGKNARLNIIWADLTKGWAVIKREVITDGDGSEYNMQGVHIGSNDSHLDLRTLQKHNHPNTFSNLLYKSVLFDNAKSVYQGLIRVEKAALFTNAYQLNRNLLMSSGVRADSIPMLEILIDEVKCSHGASSGKIDPMTLFYLMSRGLSESDAENLLIKGFVSEVGNLIKDQKLKNEWTDMLLHETEQSMNLKRGE